MNILDYVPHRSPFLMVDKILDIKIEDKIIITQKNLSHNEPFFQGHFPNNPVFPGVLMIENMAQSGVILLKNLRYEYNNYYLLKVNNFVVKEVLIPGDSFITESVLIKKKMNLFISNSIIYKIEEKDKKDKKIVAQSEIHSMGVS